MVASQPWIGILAGLGLAAVPRRVAWRAVPAHAAWRRLAVPADARRSARRREIVLYAHAKSLVRRGGHWELRVDPAQFLSGLTAQRAAVDDGAIAPGDAVPNDYYTRDESHRAAQRFASRPEHADHRDRARPEGDCDHRPGALADPRRQEDRAPAVRAAGGLLDSRRRGHGARDGPAVHPPSSCPAGCRRQPWRWRRGARGDHGVPDAWVP